MEKVKDNIKKEKVDNKETDNEEVKEELNVKDMSLIEAMLHIRAGLQRANLKKTGINKYSGYKYFQLEDFLPTLNELELEFDTLDHFTIKGEEAVLTFMKGQETLVYQLPFKSFPAPKGMTEIQNIGMHNTYYKRYLYMNALGISEADAVEELAKQKAKEEQEKLEQEEAINIRGQEIFDDIKEIFGENKEGFKVFWKDNYYPTNTLEIGKWTNDQVEEIKGYAIAYIERIYKENSKEEVINNE